MKFFKIFESSLAHPQEDFLLSSGKYPIFAVADGVTLLINEEDEYPDPSGAGEVAKIFCQKAIEAAENLYVDFSEEDILRIFNSANQSIEKYNRKCGRTEDKIDFGAFDFFHTTAALAVIKEHKIFWGNICDANVSLFDKNGTKKSDMISNWQNKPDLPPPPKDYDTWSEMEKGTYSHKFFRNKINKKRERIGYGCLTGEKDALKYVNHGVLEGKEGDILFVFTDGFENYLRLPEFINVFIDWPADIEKEVKKVTSAKSEENPGKFGHERSLVAVRL